MLLATRLRENLTNSLRSEVGTRLAQAGRHTRPLKQIFPSVI